MQKNSLKSFFLFLLMLLVSAIIHASPDIVASFSDVEELIQTSPAGKGKLVLTIESFAGKDVKRVSQLADRVEIWLGARRIASMNATDENVVTEKRRRLFPFDAIELPVGYYFITVRLYRQGSFYARDKWDGETFQVGIHSGKITRLQKSIPIFLW
ncbi:MAG: hypothetical protein ACOYXC_00040 [Candidatus Rifleibacteriota bacterium]